MAEAKQVREALEKWNSRSAFLSTWARAFWVEVDEIKVSAPQLKVILRSHGHVGAMTASPPRVEELKKQLAELASKGLCGGGASVSMLEDIESWALDEDMESWGHALPDSLQRAGPEIYRNLIGAAGRRSLRDIIDEYFPSF